MKNLKIKVPNYHLAFKHIYFRGYNIHCDPECIETPFGNTQSISASRMIHTLKGFYPVHIMLGLCYVKW